MLLPKKGGANPHIDDVLDGAMGSVQAVIVLFSPDDLACLRPSLFGKGETNTEGKRKGQPWLNVIFEAGLALGRHPEKRYSSKWARSKASATSQGSTWRGWRIDQEKGRCCAAK